VWSTPSADELEEITPFLFLLGWGVGFFLFFSFFYFFYLAGSVTGCDHAELDGVLNAQTAVTRSTGTGATTSAGQGMIHGVAFGAVRACGTRNRWRRRRSLHARVQFRGARRDHDLTGASTANTRPCLRAMRARAVENSLPFSVTPELATVRPVRFAGRLTHDDDRAIRSWNTLRGSCTVFGYGPASAC